MPMKPRGPGHPAFVDLEGQRFGRLVVTAYLGRRKRFHQWRCRCDCGSETEVYGVNLRRGNTASCGCFRRDRATVVNTFHGGASGNRSGEYLAWQNMIARCYRPSQRQYADYGGRGIQTCDRWRFGEHGLSGFQCFLADMGLKPSAAHSLDRCDVNGNYEKSNCRWATKAEPDRNKRSNVLIWWRSQMMVLRDAIAASGNNEARYYRFRARAATAQEAFDQMVATPPKRHRGSGAGRKASSRQVAA